MTKAKGRRRQEQRLKQIPTALEEPEEQQDDLEAFEEVWVPIHLTNADRIVVRIKRTGQGEVIEWHIGHQVHLDGGWQDVVTYDCSHGQEVHRHRYRHGRKGSKRVGKPLVMKGMTSTKEAFGVAYDAMCTAFEENRRRYMHD